MQRRLFLASLAAGPAAVVLGSTSRATRPLPPPKMVTIRNVHMVTDLRGEDPDRAMRAFMTPIGSRVFRTTQPI